MSEASILQQTTTQLFESNAPLSEQPSKLTLRIWRYFDVSVSGLVLLLMFPAWAVIALLIKLDSKGPVIFRHSRIGKDLETFEMLKFRTMRTDTYEKLLSEPARYLVYAENSFKLPSNDVSITRVGRVLRKLSLDEIPQLLNVLTGQMSLVGVRPLVREELAARSQVDINLYARYRPGISGLWQISGRAALSLPARAEIDREYLESWSLRLNLKILARTPIAVMKTTGAF